MYIDNRVLGFFFPVQSEVSTIVNIILCKENIDCDTDSSSRKNHRNRDSQFK